MGVAGVVNTFCRQSDDDSARVALPQVDALLMQTYQPPRQRMVDCQLVNWCVVHCTLLTKRCAQLYTGESPGVMCTVCTHEDVERGGLQGRQALGLASLVSDSSAVGYTL